MITRIGKENGIELFVIKMPQYELTLCNVGASVYDLKTFDKDGNLESIVLKQSDPFKNKAYFGSTVGRNAGRIKDGKFKLNGKEFSLPQNDNGNNSHSSGKGISHRIMHTNILKNSIEFSIMLLSGNDSFPGDITILVTYEFGQEDYTIRYFAESTEDTICNMTNHTYFNLSGNLKENILNHKLNFGDLKSYWELDATNIPIKEKQLDTSTLKEFIGKYKQEPQRGMDHPFRTKNKGICLCEKSSGRELKVTSSYDHVVLYSQNWELDELNKKVNQGLAIEFQYMPNDINQNGDSSKTILRKNKKYNEWIKYSFKKENKC